MRIRKRHLGWLLAPVFVVLLLVAIQWFLHIRQQLTIKHIESLGGRVVTTHGEPAWLLRLTGGRSLWIFEKATLVNLSRTKVKDADLLRLQRLSGLQRLNLSETEITDDGLRHLRGLTGLKALDLGGTRITGDGLEHLRNLTALEFLYLRNTEIEDADLHHLKGLKNLRHLDLRGTAVSKDGVTELKRFIPDAEVVR